MNVPRQLSPEFLLVDLVNDLGDLAEDIAGRGAAIEAQIDLRLAIPECSMLLNPGERADLPRNQISRLALQVRSKVGTGALWQHPRDAEWRVDEPRYDYQ
jgi:hypothetical protein